jgi:hypothetical protein
MALTAARRVLPAVRVVGPFITAGSSDVFAVSATDICSSHAFPPLTTGP